MKNIKLNIDENYFEELESKILSKVQKFEKKKENQKQILVSFVIIILFVVGGISFFNNTNIVSENKTEYVAYTNGIDYLNITDYDISLVMDNENSSIKETNTTAEIVDYLADYNSIDYELSNQ